MLNPKFPAKPRARSRDDKASLSSQPRDLKINGPRRNLNKWYENQTRFTA